MRVGRKARADLVPVQLSARVTEVGTVELWCRSRTDERRWRLQIQLRGPSAPKRLSLPIADERTEAVIIEQSEIDAGCAAIRQAFATLRPADEHGVSRLVKRLEEALDAPRDQWPPSALCALWDPLHESLDTRSTSPQHESRWLNLAGYCLRPGVGVPLDELRIKALWPVFHGNVLHAKDTQCWVEWWVLWRRVAAGLTRAHHEEIDRRLRPFLLPPKGGAGGKRPGRPKPEAHEIAEMWRCAAALERLSATSKEPLGEALAAELTRPALGPHVLWSLGRLGARVLLYGPANTVVGPELVTRWVERLLGRTFSNEREIADATFALSMLARVSGDRARDLDDATRQAVLARLEQWGVAEAVLRPVREFHELETAQQDQALGDSLPAGLRLIVAPAT